MPPSCPHAVFTPEDCLAVGGHFYTGPHLGSKLRGLRLQEDYPEISNEDLRPDFYSLLGSVFKDMDNIGSFTQQANILSSLSLFVDTLDVASLATLFRENRRCSHIRGATAQSSRILERLETRLTNYDRHLTASRTIFLDTLESFQKQLLKNWEGVLSHNHGYTRMVLLDFANNCAKLCRFEDAEEALKRVREVPYSHPHASLIRQSRMILKREFMLAVKIPSSPVRVVPSTTQASPSAPSVTPLSASLAKIVEIDKAIAAIDNLASGIDSVIQADFDYLSGVPWGSEEILILDKAAISELLHKVLQDDQTAGFRSRVVVTHDGDKQQPPYVQLNSIGETFRPSRIAKRQDGRLVLYSHAALYRANRALDRIKNPSVTPSAADLITELIDVGHTERALLAPRGSEL